MAQEVAEMDAGQPLMMELSRIFLKVDETNMVIDQSSMDAGGAIYRGDHAGFHQACARWDGGIRRKAALISRGMVIKQAIHQLKNENSI